MHVRNVEARRPRFDEKAANTVVGPGPYHGDVGDRAVGDPHLRAVEHPVRPVTHRAGAHRAGIGSGVGLSQAEAPNCFARSHVGQPALFLFLAAVGVDRIHGERALHADQRPQPAVHGLDFRAVQPVLGRRRALAAVAGQVHAKNAELAEVAGQLSCGQGASLVPVPDVRPEPVVGELAHRVTEQPIVVGQIGIEAEQVQAIQRISHEEPSSASIARIVRPEGGVPAKSRERSGVPAKSRSDFVGWFCGVQVRCRERRRTARSCWQVTRASGRRGYSATVPLLPFDPIERAGVLWEKHSPGEPTEVYAAMRAVTSIMRAQQVLIGELDGLLKPYGVTFSRYEALVLLSFARDGALPLSKVGERLQVHATSVTNVIDRLEAAGLVRREPNPRDGRGILAVITEDGREVVRAATERMHAARFGMSALDDAGLNQLYAVLRELRLAADDFRP